MKVINSKSTHAQSKVFENHYLAEKFCLVLMLHLSGNFTWAIFLLKSVYWVNYAMLLAHTGDSIMVLLRGKV